MATDKKHIAVYLAPEVEQALIAFCREKGLISKKGTMYSAGVNAALAQFFDTAVVDVSNTPSKFSTIPNTVSSNIPDNTTNISSNIPAKSLAVEALPGKLQA